TDLLNAGKNYRDASISLEGTRDTAPLSADVATNNQALVDKCADKLFDASATDIMAWAAEHAPGRIGVTVSMENTVLAELAAKACLDARLLFIDAGFHFPETLDTADAVEKRYPQLPLKRITPLLSPAEQDEVYGARMY